MRKLFSAALFCIFSAIVFANPVPGVSKTEATAVKLANDKNFQNLINFKLNLAAQLKATQSLELLEKLGNKQINAGEKKLLAVNLKYKDVADMDASFAAAGKYMKSIINRHSLLQDQESSKKIVNLAVKQMLRSKKITASVFVTDEDCWLEWSASSLGCYVAWQGLVAAGMDENEAFIWWLSCTAVIDLRLLACV